jgi:glutamine amidotransferase
MCRIAAYLGPSITLDRLLTDPPHSLLVQSWAPRELRYARLNADGYGFGWYPNAGQPAVYVNPDPIWTDPNLPHLGRALASGLWLASIRSATIGNPVHAFNTQPFHDDRWLFVHNGYVGNFHEQVRPSITAQLAPAIAAGICGNTDSEYLFALFRQILLDEKDIHVADALRMLFSRIGQLGGDNESLLNLLLTDGKTVYASRHAFNHESPSLYFTTTDPRFPQAQLVASEAFDPKADWQRVPEHHLLMLTADSAPHCRHCELRITIKRTASRA